MDCCIASGSRRSCAAAAVTTALNAADLLAVIAPAEHQADVAAAVRQELEAQTGVRLLSARNSRVPWLAGSAPQTESPFGLDLEALWIAISPADRGEGEPGVRRAVLFWEEVDGFIREHSAGHFDGVFRLLCKGMAAPPPEVWRPYYFHRAVLIGSDPLLERLEQIAPTLPDGVRCRYVLVR